jgi:hypothetical protein
VLLLHGGVDVDPLQLAGLDDLKPQTSLDSLPEQLLGTRLTDALLPVRVLDPSSENGLVTKVMGVLQVMQGDHQPRRDPGPACLAGVAHAKVLVEALPVDSLR